MIELRINSKNDVECDHGVFTNTEGDPTEGFRHLALVGADWVTELLVDGPKQDQFGSICRVEMRHGPDELYYHVERGGTHYVWRLFDAKWWDGLPCRAFVGLWMD